MKSRKAARVSARRKRAGSSRRTSRPSAPHQQQVDYYMRRERAAFTVGDAAIRLEALRRLVQLTEAPDKLSPYVTVSVARVVESRQPDGSTGTGGVARAPPRPRHPCSASPMPSSSASTMPTLVTATVPQPC